MEKNDSRVEFSRKTFPWKKLLIKRTLIFFVFKQIRLKNIMLSSTEKFSISEIGKSFTKLSIGLTWIRNSVRNFPNFLKGCLSFQTNVHFPFLSTVYQTCTSRKEKKNFICTRCPGSIQPFTRFTSFTLK